MDALEQEALDALKKYKKLMQAFAPGLIGLLLKIATRLEWHHLKGELEK